MKRTERLGLPLTCEQLANTEVWIMLVEHIFHGFDLETTGLTNQSLKFLEDIFYYIVLITYYYYSEYAFLTKSQFAAQLYQKNVS
jgi:hypothetical protein